MFIIIFAHIAILFVELVITSTNTNRTSSPGFEDDTFTYCDPEYYTVNIVASYDIADNKCASKCSFLRGYINSQNELVCYYHERSQARIISGSRLDVVSEGECVCGSKDRSKDNRQACYPPFVLNYEDCRDTRCENYTLLRGKKFNGNAINVMWCGKEWIENNVIHELDHMVKEVRHFINNTDPVETSYSCFCGSKSRKANTFISKDTAKKMEQRKLSRNSDGRDLDKFVATCSFGKFRINKATKSKCESVCTTRKAFFLLDRRELICYSDKMPANIHYLNDNICTCGTTATYGRVEYAGRKECNPVIKKEKKKGVDDKTFKDDCEIMCVNHNAFINFNAVSVQLVYCEIGISPSPKISVDFRLQYKLGEISEDNQLIECECGLTEYSLIEIGDPNIINKIASSLRSGNKNVDADNTANSSNPSGGIFNGGKSTEEIERSPFRMSRSASLSLAKNRTGNTHQIGNSSQAASLKQIVNSGPTCNRDGMTSQIETSLETLNQIGIENLLRTSPHAENRSTEASHNGSRIQIGNLPPMRNSDGKVTRVSSFSQLITHGGKQNQVANLPRVANNNASSSQTESSKQIQTSLPTLNRDGMQRHVATSSQSRHQIGIGNRVATSPQATNNSSGSSQKGGRIEIKSSPTMWNSGGMVKRVASFSQLFVQGGNPNQVTNSPRSATINLKSTQTETWHQTANLRSTVSLVGITNKNSTLSQADNRGEYTNTISPSPRAVRHSGISQGSSNQNAISTDRLDPNRKGNPLTFNRCSSSSNATNLIENANQIASSRRTISNRNLSTGSSRKINHGAGSSSELNDGDNYMFGEILKNASFVDKLRYDYENELFRIPPHNNQVMPVGFDIIPSKNSQREIKANSKLSQAPSASMRDTASSKYNNPDEVKIFGEILDDVPFLNSLAGYKHPVTIDALRSFSPVRDELPPFPNCNHKRMLDDSDLEATFSLPDFNHFPTLDIIPVNYGCEICSSSLANQTTPSHGKRMRN